MTRKYQTVVSVIACGLVFAFMSNQEPQQQEVQRAAKQLAALFVEMIDMKNNRKKKLAKIKKNNE